MSGPDPIEKASRVCDRSGCANASSWPRRRFCSDECADAKRQADRRERIRQSDAAYECARLAELMRNGRVVSYVDGAEIDSEVAELWREDKRRFARFVAE